MAGRFVSYCRPCATEHSSTYRKNNREKINAYKRRVAGDNRDLHNARQREYQNKNRLEIRAYNRASYAKHREKRVAERRDYYKKNREKCLGQTSSYREKNKGYFSAYNREYQEKNYGQLRRKSAARERIRYLTDPAFRIHRNMRKSISSGLKNVGLQKNYAASRDFVGCSFLELKNRLEGLFLPGMTWENYGVFSGYENYWEIGHKKPVASYDLLDPEQVKECWHFSNLFPQWQKDNIKASATFGGVNFRGLRAEQWEISEISDLEASEFVKVHHYSKSCSKIITRAFGLFRKDSPSDLFGVTVWMPPTVGAAVLVCPEEPKFVLSLSRMVLLPECPKNAASYFLSRCVKSLKQDKRWKALVTYADTWQGHTGTIYRAANWTYDGETLPYSVWTKDGKMMSNRAGPVTFTHPQMRERGCILEGKFSKHRFILRF